MPNKDLPTELQMPSQSELDSNLRPEILEAQELATKLEQGKTKTPTGYIVNHDGVGDGHTVWHKNAKINPDELADHFKSKGLEGEAIESAITRLVSVNALVPVFG